MTPASQSDNSGMNEAREIARAAKAEIDTFNAEKFGPYVAPLGPTNAELNEAGNLRPTPEQSNEKELGIYPAQANERQKPGRWKPNEPTSRPIHSNLAHINFRDAIKCGNKLLTYATSDEYKIHIFDSGLVYVMSKRDGKKSISHVSNLIYATED